MRLILARTIRHAHTAIILLALIGWLLPTPGLLKIYAIAMGAMIVQWLLCDNRCILTIWEDRLLGGTNTPGAESFVARLIESLTGSKPSGVFVNLISYGLACGCAALALLRMYLVER